VARIDPTARVADGARLGAEVEIGPYSIVGSDVTLGDGCRLISHVHVAGLTSIGARTVIHPFASIGGPPQSVHYKGEPSRLVIGADCTIRECVTMSTGTASGRMETRVGDRCMFMWGAHVGHDCLVGNDTIFANAASLGGHSSVGDFVFFGALCGVHQFVRIGEHVVVGGLTGVDFDVIPFGAVIGGRAELGGLNIVGLKRRGFTREAIHSLRRAYRMLFFGPGVLAERIPEVAAAFPDDAHVQRIIEFIREGGKRRLTLPRTRASNEEP
jgi:UDP-N-acetylglucosamine acyltransferase